MDDRYAIPDPHAQTSLLRPTTRRGQSGRRAAGRDRGRRGAAEDRRRADRARRRPALAGGEGRAREGLAGGRASSGSTRATRSCARAPRSGIMETDWYEDRAKIPQDFIRRTIGKVIERHVLDAAARQVPHPPGAGRRARHHRDLREQPRVEEVYTSEYAGPTRCGSRGPPTASSRPRCCTRMMVKFGGDETKVATAAAAAAGSPRPSRRRADESRNAVLRERRRGPAGRERRLRPRLAPRRPRARPRRLHRRGPRPLQGPLLRALHRSRRGPRRGPEEELGATSSCSGSRTPTRSPSRNTAST